MPSVMVGRLEDQDREQLLQTARRLLAEADALSTRITAVNEIGVAINRTLDLNAILKVVGKQAKWLLDFEYCSVCLQEHSTAVWRVITLFGQPQIAPDDLLTTENVGVAIRTRQPQLLGTGSLSLFMGEFSSQVIIPLLAENTVLGTINFATTQPRCYTQDDMRIGYMLALQLSSAIRNAHNFEELQQAQRELQLYARELEARNQELDAFSHTIAHDLKAPLSIISLKTDLIRAKHAETLSDELVKDMELIKKGTSTMGNMIDQLLWLARLRNVKDTLSCVPMGQVAQAAVWRFSPSLAEKGIQVEIQPNLPDAMGHAQWVEEVFANLISNAIKYMGNENPHPTIRITGSEQDDKVCYRVEDSGVGITPEDQARLFTMFTRLHTVKAEGLGLGLSIVHRIVTKLQGQVGVESQFGVGSTFWFTLLKPSPQAKVEVL